MNFNQYLTEHGINQTSIEKFGLEDLGDRIGIPVKDSDGNILFRKYRNLSYSQNTNIPKFIFDKGSHAALFNPAALKEPRVVICEGEVDCIRLDQEGIASVSGTAGASTFPDEWAKQLKDKACFICYDTDEPGKKNAQKVANKLTKAGVNAKVVDLSEKYKDVCEYFADSHSKEDFLKLCDEAKSHESSEEDEKSKIVSLAQLIIKALEDLGVLFFHNEEKDGFAAIKGDGSEVYKIKSKKFRQFVGLEVYNLIGSVLPSNTLKDILQILEAKGVFEGPLYALDSRIVFKDNSVWYDLGDGRIVKIDSERWKIVKNPPILFRNYTHQQAQLTPLHDGDLKELCNFVNLKTQDDQLLFLVFTVAAFIPGFPHPMLVFHGPQGSGKTTPQRLLKSLIDPSALKELSAPDNEKEFVQIAAHHYFFFFDNLSSSLRDWLSDSLCKAVTGGGFSKRELYSDDDDFIYTFRRVIGLNGINLMVQKPDLLERSILIYLERITKKDRREEKEFWEEFEQKKPYLLGAIFDVVSKAIQEYPNIKLTEHPRMADFAHWGCAIAKVLGYSQDEFLSVYNKNLSQQNEEAIEASPVAATVIELMTKRDRWEGSPTELYEELKTLAVELKIFEWPRGAAAFSKKLNIVQTNLAEAGINIIRDRKDRRKITIQKVKDFPDEADIVTGETGFEANSELSGATDQDFTLDDDGDDSFELQKDSRSASSGVQGQPKPCRTCNGTEFWKRKSDNELVCTKCHPPISEDNVKEGAGED